MLNIFNKIIKKDEPVKINSMVEPILNEVKSEKKEPIKDPKKFFKWVKTKGYHEDIKVFNDKNKNVKSITILLVDDSLTIRKYIGDILIKLNYDVIIKNDGLDAFDYLQKNKKPALLITDIEMPKMDGIELVKKLRNDSKFSKMPILVISAHVEKHIELMEKELIEGFMHKPFDNNEFKKQLNYLLN